MRLTVPIVSILLLSACSVEPGSEQWCAQMEDKSKTEWTFDEGTTYASHCLIDSMTIGSESWCAELEDKPKADWTAGEAADYAKHCVM